MQIDLIYRHPRDGDGRLVPPKMPEASRPLTIEEELAKAGAVMAAFGIPAEKQAEAEALIRARRGGG